MGSAREANYSTELALGGQCGDGNMFLSWFEGVFEITCLSIKVYNLLET